MTLSLDTEETINTELNDRFIIKCYPHDLHGNRLVQIHDRDKREITYVFYNDQPEKDDFKLIKNTPNLRCYYIYNCLVYRLYHQSWEGVCLNNLENSIYTQTVKNMPVEIRLLAEEILADRKLQAVNEEPTRTELGDEFIREYSRLPSGDPENGTTIKIKHPQSRNTIVSIGPVYNAKMEDFQTLLNTPEMRCYRIYDCLIYMADYTDKGKWEGIPLDFLKHEESYYWSLEVPGEIRDLGKQILQEERRNKIKSQN